MSGTKLFVGTAGWAIPPQTRDLFVGEGSNLEKYSRFHNAAEINSSFYRDHKPETYDRWAESVPSDFRFTVKLNKYFTREKKLTETGDKLKETLEGILQLKEKMGALLIQIPGSLKFDERTVDHFFEGLRKLYDGDVVFEPRHISWATQEAADLLGIYNINKVLADPEPCRMPRELRPQVENVTYFRLHGSPEMYKSRYPIEVVSRVATQMRKVAQSGGVAWCIFDNTTFGHALDNALELTFLLENEIDQDNLETEMESQRPRI